ncbi:MAG TPA: conjugal transfer protein [Symbiobacteriaceae bacterium]|nr:conjugal transfer protein [Symbiobacteriaceae bacterium]
MDRRIRLHTYAQVWRLERVIYQIEGISLPFAVTVQQVAIFFGTAAAMAVLSHLVPGFAHIGLLVRYVALPALISWFLTRQRLDGKVPHRWLLSMLAYWAGPKRLNRLQPMATGERRRIQIIVGFGRE